MRVRTKQMVYAALLTALALIIPIQFSFLRVIIPPFTATLMAHVPMFIAMMISPMVAIVVGVGSAIGFIFAGSDLVIVARAATHILVGYVGAQIIIRNRSFIKASIFTAPLHGIAEALVVIPFIGLDLYKLLIVTAVGTILHHGVDSCISGALLKSMAKAKGTSIYDLFSVKSSEVKYDKEVA